MRGVPFVAGAAVVAGAAIALLVACKHGDYDGSFDGGAVVVDDRPSTSRVVQPDQADNVSSLDGVLTVSFGAGTFATPATITITTAGEQTLSAGIVVPIYVVAADREPTKFFQVSMNGNGNAVGGMTDRALVTTVLSEGTYKPLPIVGNANNMGGSASAYWGLTKSFGTFSLAFVIGTQSSSFPESSASCTAQCCRTMNSTQLSTTPSGCYCPAEADLNCFLEHCASLDAPATRCMEIAAEKTGKFDCKPLGFNCQTGGGSCNSCSTGGPSNNSACCLPNNGGGGPSCDVATCQVFSTRCTKETPCPGGTQCCVFESESYCAKDCPPAQLACAKNADCTDAGADAGTCQGGKCPVGLCGAAPEKCR